MKSIVKKSAAAAVNESATAAAVVAADNTSRKPMKWKKIVVDNAVLTLWPGAVVRDSDLNGFHAFFQEEFHIEITPVGCVETLPDSDEHGESIEGTGGRVDFFFFVNAQDISKFAFKRFKFGMRWWEDIYFNNGEDIYPFEFCSAYPDPSTY